MEIERLLRKELRQKGVPVGLGLAGDPFLVSVAESLLRRIHGERLRLGSGETYRATTREHYLEAQLRAFLEDEEPDDGPVLMETLPETLIAAYAAQEGFTGAPPGHGDVHALIRQLQEAQPQTVHALQKSFAWLAAEEEKGRKSVGPSGKP